MKRIIQITILLLSTVAVNSQVIPLNEIGQLDDLISEPSGVNVLYNPMNGHMEYWVHNDANNLNDIYALQLHDVTVIRRTVEVGLPYIDWEDMAIDSAGAIYLGDFGNFVKQDELQIVKVLNPQTAGSDTANTQIIEFIYPFDGIYDCESMVHLNGHLYIFSKRASENADPPLDDRYSYCFRIPDSPAAPGAKHTAVFMDSFMTALPGDVDSTRFRFTGADLSPDKKVLALTCYERFWVFSGFSGDDFFGGTASHFEVPYRQYEGISFANNHDVVISKEGKASDSLYNPKLYHLDLSPWIDGSVVDCEKAVNGDFSQSNLAWSKFTAMGGTANLNIAGGQAHIEVITAGTSHWHINMRHKGVILENGKTYRVRFKAHADANRGISIILNNRSGTLGYGYMAQAITTTPTYYEFEFTMNEASDYNSYLSLNVGKFSSAVYFDDVSLMAVDCICPANRYFFAEMNNRIEHFEVSDMIYGHNAILGTDVIYDAGNAVELNQGFEVSLGTLFEAYVDGCN